MFKNHQPISGQDRVSFKPIFAKNKATNPEELLGSAHASCYTLTLSYILTEAGIKAESLETSVALTINNNLITNSDLQLTAKIFGIREELFQELAFKAKEMCAVGNALNANIGLEATLIS